MTWPIGPVSWKSGAIGNHVLHERIDFLKDPGNEPRDGVACFSRARACVCLARDKCALCHRKSFTKTKDFSNNKGRGLLIPFTVSRSGGPRRKVRDGMVLLNAQRRCNETKQITKMDTRSNLEIMREIGEENKWLASSRPISYSSVDPRYHTKSILRKISARLRKRGFISWMNEHPLPVWQGGDYFLGAPPSLFCHHGETC